MISCFGATELSPRYVNPASHEAIDATASFPGVHLHGIADDWFYVTMIGPGLGDGACVGSLAYDAVFWLSINPLHDAPSANVEEIILMRKDLWSGEWVVAIERAPDLASATYLVNRDQDGLHAEIQKTAYRRLTDRNGKLRTFSLHGRWPHQYDHVVRPVFDHIVKSATFQ